MVYGSVCSGIEAATVAWEPLGWKAGWFSEIDPFCCALLRHHYPRVINHGDFTEIEAAESGPIDILCGGTPCQDFSVAGLRAGLAGSRGKLTLEFIKLAGRLRPRWVVWENVPGVLSIDGGRAFGAFLGGLAKFGYGFAYRVLDAQYFGVPQRRRRVFVVGYLGDWRPPAAVLFERYCLSGDTAPRRNAGQGVAGTLGARTEGGGGLGTDFDLDGGLVAMALRGQTNATHRADSDTYIPSASRCLNAGGMGVRRLTPLECERLQGFPDGYTLVPYRGKLAADGCRYHTLGNSMAVPVMKWIGERIQMVETLDSARKIGLSL